MPTLRCSICGLLRRYDAAKQIAWCPTCDFDIPGLSPSMPDDPKRLKEKQ